MWGKRIFQDTSKTAEYLERDFGSSCEAKPITGIWKRSSTGILFGRVLNSDCHITCDVSLAITNYACTIFLRANSLNFVQNWLQNSKILILIGHCLYQQLCVSEIVKINRALLLCESVGHYTTNYWTCNRNCQRK